MNEDFIIDLSDSAYDTERLILPKIKELGWLEGEFMQTESLAWLTKVKGSVDKDLKELTQNFDALSGIDVLYADSKNGIIGIANRIQWTNKSWASFTIRTKLPSGHETEYQKRVRALKSNGKYIYPYITIQSYIEEPRRIGKLISIGMGYTKDIIKMIDEGRCKIKINPTDQIEFYTCFWKEMKERGFEVNIWTKDKKN